MKSPERSRAVGFASKSPVPVPSANFTPETKLDFIRKGKKKKTITGFKENKNVTIENKGGKFVIVEKEKKFEESAVTQRKNNFVKFESKLGTEKETDLTKIAGIKKTREIEPRTEETIIQKRKKKEYLDNYQYHETVDIKHPKPNKISIVEHKRLGDIIGGAEEIATYERTVKTTMGDGRPTQVLKQKATSVKKTGKDPNKPGTSTITKTTKRELKPYNSQINLRNNQNVMQPSASTRRFGRNGAKDNTDSIKEETKLDTKEGQTTKTTRKIRGRGSILKNKEN
jgi:hypothetical protein